MKLYKSLKHLAVMAGISLSTSAAFAGNTLQSSDSFIGFYDTVLGWTQGALGVGLATTMLLMGGAIGVAKNSPMPALTGIGGAAILHWGPDVIKSIMVTGGLI
ncbi:MAG: TraA family conjugative transfer protein [Agitococcus sp.]|nr:TraA family conjugative transfer protein [Agitococcus sp.]MDO9177000.1 TraA family conjugative transfer protein [Agitococcus sp.]